MFQCAFFYFQHFLFGLRMKLTFFVVGVAALIVTAPGAYTATTSSTPAMTTPPVLGRPPGKVAFKAILKANPT
jgi:hypothetical protein